MGRDGGKVADEIIAHQNGLVGANVKVALDIQADIPDGVPDNVVRIFTEIGNTMKFKDHGFEG